MSERLSFPLIGKATLEVEIDAEKALRQIEQREQRVASPRPLLERMAQVMREALGRRFTEGGRPPWQPLAPSTVAAKSLAGLPPVGRNGKVLPRLVQNGMTGAAAAATAILIRTGALRDSWRRKGAKGHSEVYNESPEEASVAVGSTLPIARIHQEGTGPYMILPKNGKALRFIGASGGPVVRRVVHHPGLPARPVLLTEADQRQIEEVAARWMGGEPE